MKPQDIVFIIIFIIVLFLSKKNRKYVVIAGLACIALAIPLFMKHIFFTAERLLIYSYFFLFTSVIVGFFSRK